MTVLSDVTLRERGPELLAPFEARYVQPASVDLRLSASVTLWPFVFRLASTHEWVTMPSDLQGQVHGRSSVGRKGILVHFTAGFIDPGFRGEITLELMNLTFWPVRLLAGDRVAQIAFLRMDRSVAEPYRGRYQRQRGATPSRFRHGDD